MVTVAGDAPSLDICGLGERPPCLQGATCSNVYHSLNQDVDYHCDCPVGYIGHNCETAGKLPPKLLKLLRLLFNLFPVLL